MDSEHVWNLCDAAWLRAQTPEEIAAGKQRVIKLVIDGYALLYHLYFHNNFNCVCGGQYAQFAGAHRPVGAHERVSVPTLLTCVEHVSSPNPLKIVPCVNRPIAITCCSGVRTIWVGCT